MAATWVQFFERSVFTLDVPDVGAGRAEDLREDAAVCVDQQAKVAVFGLPFRKAAGPVVDTLGLFDPDRDGKFLGNLALVALCLVDCVGAV